MKNRALLALLMIILLVLIGCTGCDSDPKSVDLTQTREILTNPGGWLAQEKYLLAEEEYSRLLVMAIDPQNTAVYSVAVMDSDDSDVDMGRIEYAQDEVVFTSYSTGEEFSLRITSEADTSNPVLTLTSKTSGEKMYFSMGGSA